ncbi:MAG: hypothetical protein B7Z57_11700 [Acidiphilium sp. 37-60-79]|nr:MAG: hypothetical protein B7Z57_11700 [Acidiphilium sp. 37-60-79]OZB40877.1 MAG: hypothetical protein B7X48_03370 [Acidiphilium sp. 34-60-192]
MKRRSMVGSWDHGFWDWVKESPETVTVFLAAMICLFFWPHEVFDCVRVASAAIYAVLESLAH